MVVESLVFKVLIKILGRFVGVVIFESFCFILFGVLFSVLIS